MDLALSNYSSFEGAPYCKAHFEQLFKETGSYNKSFQSQSPAKSTPEKLAPELTRWPSKAARMFSGTQDKCATCGKTAYPLEKGPRKRVGEAQTRHQGGDMEEVLLLMCRIQVVGMLSEELV